MSVETDGQREREREAEKESGGETGRQTDKQRGDELEPPNQKWLQLNECVL